MMTKGYNLQTQTGCTSTKASQIFGSCSSNTGLVGGSVPEIAMGEVVLNDEEKIISDCCASLKFHVCTVTTYVST
ncbi:hypothetical protein L6452_01649 [Arctium lappa]|uniref:Uncharacterized protein n=1 Tax=Arctium lappa TaxID=4217 RepID=A0ACB9FGP9_ARCLA|nr:hypothetical protein L6452_01649 [Arctium lappa]